MDIAEITVERVQEIGQTIKELEPHDRVRLISNRWDEYRTCEVLEKVDQLGGDEFYRALLEDEDGDRIELYVNWRDIPEHDEDQETPYTGALVAPFDDTSPPVVDIELLD